MPRNGALVLTDLPDRKLRLHCSSCGLCRQYDVDALRNKVGNALLPGLIDELARRNGCKKRARTVYDRCGVRIVGADDPAWIEGRLAEHMK